MPLEQPCSPEEIERIAQLMADKSNVGKVKVEDVDVHEYLNEEKVGPVKGWVKTGMGWFGHVRTLRGMMGDRFSAEAHNDIVRSHTKMHNYQGMFIKKYNDATAGLQSTNTFTGSLKNKMFGLSKEVDRELGLALEQIDSGGVWKSEQAKKRFSLPVQEAAPKVRAVYDEAADFFGIPADMFIQGYLPHMKTKPVGRGLFFNAERPGILEDRFVRQLNADQIRWLHELERTGGMLDYELRSSVAFANYVRTGLRTKIMKPTLQDVESRVVNPMFNVRFIKDSSGRPHILVNDKVGYNAWNEYQHYLLGGPTSQDLIISRSLKNMAQTFGKDADVSTLYTMSNAISNMFYMGVLGSPIGGRPASVIRQLFQIVPTIADLGPKHVIQGTNRFFANPRAEIQRLSELGLLTSHVDNLVTSMEAARGVGRAVATVTDGAMKMFSFADKFTRVQTALAAESKFDAYHSLGKLDSLGMRKELKQEVLRRVNSGRVEDARVLYMMDTLANLQYVYGAANKPQVFRGALGNLLGILTAYPLNTFEMARMFAKRAVPEKFGGAGDPAPMLRLIALTSLVMGGGSQILDADLGSAMWYNAAPHSLFMPKLGIDTFMSGVSTAEWLTGSLFDVGETKFERNKRYEWYREMSGDYASFLPAWGAAKDFSRIVDEGSLTRLFALSPRAARREELARERQRAAREERSNEGILRGF